MNKKPQDNLTIREVLALKVLLFIVKIVKPYEWAHEFDTVYKDIEGLISKEAKQ